MNEYSTYDPVTGLITGYLKPGTTPIEMVQLVHPHIVPGRWARDQYRVVNGVAVAESVPVDISTLAIAQRQHRNQLLAAVDRVNPIWYAALSTQQQTELATYRQALLDVPQQAGWPESMTWPSQPAWL